MRSVRLIAVTVLASAGYIAYQVDAQSPNRQEQVRVRSKQAEERGLAEPFKGITTNGEVQRGLYTVRSTGVSTAPVKKAADTFLAALTAEQKSKTVYDVEDPEWRKWMNQHFYLRQGVGFNEMSESQREAAFGLLRASLSAKGLALSRDIMKLNHTLGELNNNSEEYGEWLYWITLMGTPSEKEPWGWQLDGHHLIINYFVLGDQVVMTPSFYGSEPVIAKTGKYAGTTILQDEQNKALAFVKGLTDGQRDKAIVQVSKTGNNNVGEAFKDNVKLEYTGIKASELSPDQRKQLLELAALYVNNMREGHAKVRMAEVEKHVNETYFSWVGGTEPDSVFYYRIHSPVVLIEFDHQNPVAMPGVPRGRPFREHIHAVVRTPNGNDYGKDLLRQHYEKHPHPHQH